MTPFDITTATPQQIVDRVAERLRDGKGRCVENIACCYWRRVDGNMCAVGYLLPNPQVLDGVVAPVSSLIQGVHGGRLGAPVISALFRHRGLLQELQMLHDSYRNWTRDGEEIGALGTRGESEFIHVCHAHGLTYPKKEETADA